MARTRYSSSAMDDVGFDRRRGRRFDPATLLGLMAAFGLVALAMAVGGSPKSFVDVSALLIVLGGTVGVTMISFSLEEVIRTHAIVAKTVLRSVPDPAGIARRMIDLSVVARQRGELAIEHAVNDEVAHPFGRRALQMVVDGEPTDEIEKILRREIEEMRQRHYNGASVLRRAAEAAPAMGLIGTLIGLVQMLGNLDDPSTIGPNMAIALLTTFYGAVLSSMLLAPLASKLERNSEREALTANIYMFAATSISRKENPRRLETLLNALLPPANRITNFA
ncbi:MAG: MotA/TolQ/ExbB proton channel family protein [Rhodospirillaceae bacterium]